MSDRRNDKVAGTADVGDEQVIWTPNMPDRRLADRRAGIDRRSVNGRTVLVPDLRNSSERRGEDRRKVRLTITGRAIDVGNES